ncbi:MAG: tyrosine-type recombinase/integrase [Thermoleophilia bacterium]
MAHSVLRRLPQRATRPVLVRPGQSVCGRHPANAEDEDEDFVFHAKDNPRRALSYWNFRARGFEPALKEAGLDGKGITVHQLRHAAVSMYASAGMTTVEVAAIVGHSDPSVTAKVYSHLFDRSEVEARVRAAQSSI